MISLATTRVVDASVQSELLECVVPLPWGPCLESDLPGSGFLG